VDLSDSPSQAEFRARLRAWLQENLPAEPEPDDMRGRFDYLRRWQQKLYEGGWSALSWPREYGGQGLGPLEESVFGQELARAGAPPSLPLGHLGRPFITHGTPEQQQRYLPRMLAVKDIWCQGFSEPDAGSDLASLRTAAVLHGGRYVLSGQKVWTSFGAFADHCMVLARTDPDVPKHKGISVFLLPLDSPGVTVRPIVLANGDEEFAEVFLDDVAVQAEDMLGEPGQGWEIALSTISYERGAMDTGYQVKFERYFGELIDELRDQPGLLDDTSALERLGGVSTALEVFRMHCLRGLSRRAAGEPPGFASSIDKLLMTLVEQQLMETALSLPDDKTGEHYERWFGRYLYGRAGSIYGGSAQIQKSILAERVLGLRFRSA
jgi:alkylation response protein AidB-like acyl-CoA dehydrogenase